MSGPMKIPHHNQYNEHYIHNYHANAAVNTLALILAGGSGSRLQSLTRWHSKPAIPFGAKYRTIDFPLSNCINSHIRKISILTQYKSHSLNTHIQKGWNFLRPELNEFINLIPAQQRLKDSWYQGTADAVYQNLDIFRSHNTKYVLILAGDHIYKMNYAPMIQHHIECGADVTVGCIDVPLREAHAFGVMTIDKDSRISQFTEKPKLPEPTAYDSTKALVSMGIYVFSRDYLYNTLIDDAQNKFSTHDFGHDIIPSSLDTGNVYAYHFKNQFIAPDSADTRSVNTTHSDDSGAYWRDVGTVDSYYKANIELTEVTPKLNLYDANWPIWTYQEQLPPAKFVFNDDGRRGTAVDSIISSGCIISGSSVIKSVLFNNVRIHSYCSIAGSLILPNADIGRHCTLQNVIIDRGCKIPEKSVIGFNREEDIKRYYVSPEGIVLVSPEMLGQEFYDAA